MVTFQDWKESLAWFTRDRVQGFPTSSSAAIWGRKSRPTAPRLQVSTSKVTKCHTDGKKLQKALKKKKRKSRARKFQTSFGIGIHKVKQLEEKGLNHSCAMLRLEPAARAEILDCHQQLSKIAGPMCSWGVFKVAAKKSQEVVISLPSLSTSNAQGITLLLRKAQMHPRFHYCV